jgi:DNA-directed RNA polymerase specialized sigma24 family protein
MSREHAVTPHPMSLSPETAAPFPPTRWSLVVSSHGQEESALGELCRLYWQPLYSFCRRSGLGIEDAEDVTQHFFHDLLKNRAGLLEGADPAGGRLRSLFLRVIQRRIVDHHRHATRVIRGGGKTVSLDTEAAEAGLQAIAPTATAEQVFDRQWALSVLQLALARMEKDFTAAGRARHFEALAPFLDLGTEERSYDSLRGALQLDEAAARQAVHRFRNRFRRHLRCEIAETIADAGEDAIDRELGELCAILREG